MWNKIKHFFKSSETIFWARLQAFSGFVLAVLSTIDWTQLASVGLTWKQSAVLGAALFVNGVFTEYLRRRRDPELKSR